MLVLDPDYDLTGPELLLGLKAVVLALDIVLHSGVGRGPHDIKRDKEVKMLT